MTVTPMPDRRKLEVALAKPDSQRTFQEVQEISEAARWALHALHPDADFIESTTQNPLMPVTFRAGLLAMREHIACWLEGSPHENAAPDVRSLWFAPLGDDPGPPRLFDYKELVDEQPTRLAAKPISSSVEALPRAFQFLQWVKTHG